MSKNKKTEQNLTQKYSSENTSFKHYNEKAPSKFLESKETKSSSVLNSDERKYQNFLERLKFKKAKLDAETKAKSLKLIDYLPEKSRKRKMF